MPPIGNFDLAAHRAAKQAAREQDDAALRSGAMSAGQLRMNNGLFSSFNVENAVIRRRR